MCVNNIPVGIRTWNLWSSTELIWIIRLINRVVDLFLLYLTSSFQLTKLLPAGFGFPTFECEDLGIVYVGS